MVNELAVGYVSIVATTNGIASLIAKELGAAESSAAGYGRRIGAQISRGVQAAKPIDVKELEQTFATAEKSRAATVKRTTTEIEGLRRKESIAQAQLTEAEGKYAAGSVQVLRAQDRLATASQKVALAVAKQEVEVGKADKTVAAAKQALDDYSAGATRTQSAAARAFSGITSAAGTMARGTGSAIAQAARGDWSGLTSRAGSAFSTIISKGNAFGATLGRTLSAAGTSVGKSFTDVGRGIGDTFRKVASGDIAGAFGNIKSAASTAAGGIKSVFSKVGDLLGPLVKGGSKAGRDTGMSFSAGAKPAFAEAASKAGETFKSTLAAMLTATGITKILGGIKSALTSAFGGGFDRVMNIQNAEIKLETLAKSAGLTGQAVKDSVAASMKSVGDAVDGTKFAISDAADMASQLGAAGVKSGTDMTRWLSLTADAAQFSNREFGDMQRTIGKVVAEGKVTGETFQELPLAAAALSKSLGIPQAEVRKLASEGKISAEQFAEAMEGMIGGAAKDAGASFMSLRDNIKSALNATMANFIKPITDAMMPIMQAGLGLVKGFRDNVAKPLGASLGEFLQPKAEALAGAMEKIPAIFAGVKSLLADGDFTSELSGAGIEEDSPLVGGLLLARNAITEVRGGIAAFRAAWRDANGDVTSSGFAGVMESIANTVRSVFDGAKDAISGFLEGFGGIDELGQSFGPVLGLLTGPLGLLKGALGDVFKDLDFGAVGKTMGQSLKPIVQTLADLGGSLQKTLGEALAKLLPVIGDMANRLLPVLATTLGAIAPVVAQVVSALVPLVAQLVAQLAPVLVELIAQVMPPIIALIGALVPVILEVVAAVVPLVTQLASALIPVISAVISAVVPLITQLVAGLAPIITMLVQSVIPPLTQILGVVAEIISTVVVPVITFLAGFLTGVLATAFRILTPVVQTVFGVIMAVINTVIGVIVAVIRTGLGLINTNWSSVWNGIKSFFAAVWEGIKSGVTAAINAVKTTISNVTSAISSAWRGAWDGIKSAGKAAWDWISSTVGGVFNTMKSSIETTFTNMKTGLGRIWDGIKSVFAKPINAVIRFINDGIIGGYNSVAKVFKMSEIGRIKPLPGYHDGGFTGPGGKYDPAGIVHAGEWVLTKAQVARMGGPRGVESWLSHGLSVPGYAGGGLVSYQGKTFTALFASLLRRANELGGGGMHITQGGFRPATSYSGTSHRGDAVDITGSYRKFIAPLRSLGIPTWDRAGKGNWVDHAHGVPLPGSGSAAGSAAWQAQDYLRGGDGLGGRDNGPRGGVIDSIVQGIKGALGAGFNSVTEWFGGVTEKLAAPFRALSGSGGGMLGDLVVGIGTKLKDELTAWVKSTLGIGAATGTMSATRGPLLVGERGPEYLWASGGEAVIPADRVGADGASVRIGTLNLTLPAWVEDFDDMVAFIRQLGLQAHLSGGAA